MELAREHRLPGQVRDFIDAASRDGSGDVLLPKGAGEGWGRESVASSPIRGPSRKRRETAIVMLADSAEAAVRGSSERSPAEIDARVDEVIAERLAEGQLDESDLTLRELNVISESFKATLRGVYHPRLEYPRSGRR